MVNSEKNQTYTLPVKNRIFVFHRPKGPYSRKYRFSNATSRFDRQHFLLLEMVINLFIIKAFSERYNKSSHHPPKSLKIPKFCLFKN